MPKLTFARSFTTLALVVLPFATLPAQRMTAAVGPAFPLLLPEDGPGTYARLGVAMREGAPRWNLELDGYYTRWRHTTYLSDDFGEDVRPRDTGIAMTGTFAVLREHRVSPFLRAGGAWHWTAATVRQSDGSAAGAPVWRSTHDGWESTGFGMILGAGTNVRVGSRAVRAEARLQGGWDVNVPVTIGVTF
jgi:hypothetical protein